jgi:hypothetical protein
MGAVRCRGARRRGLRFLEDQRDYLKEAENGVLAPVPQLFVDFVEREYAVGVVEENAPLAFLFPPRTPIGVNYAFAEIGTEDLDELCSPGSIDVTSASVSFNEPVEPFYGLTVVAELEFYFRKMTEAIDHQLRILADFVFRRHFVSALREDTTNTDKVLAQTIGHTAATWR